jgi:hypothetical protein
MTLADYIYATVMLAGIIGLVIGYRKMGNR